MYLSRACCLTRPRLSSPNHPHSWHSSTLCRGQPPYLSGADLLEHLENLIAAVAHSGTEARLANLRLNLLDRHAGTDVSSCGADHVLLHHRAAKVVRAAV